MNMLNLSKTLGVFLHVHLQPNFVYVVWSAIWD